MKTRVHFLSILALAAAGMMSNAYAESYDTAKINNTLSVGMRFAGSCQGLQMWNATHIAAKTTGGVGARVNANDTWYADAPGFANCMPISVRGGKSYKFYDDKGKLGFK